MSAGFDSPSHFAAVTKKMMGICASKSLKHSEFLKFDCFIMNPYLDEVSRIKAIYDFVRNEILFGYKPRM